MVGSKFDPSKNYPKTMVSLFIACCYCSGMPILLVFSTVTMFLMFSVEKYLILNEYSKGQFLDEKTNDSNFFNSSGYEIS